MITIPAKRCAQAALTVALMLFVSATASAGQVVGDVTAKLKGGVLILEGDADLNYLSLVGKGSNIFVSPSSGATLNGGFSTVLFMDVQRIKLRDEGDIFLTLDALDLPGDFVARFDGNGDIAVDSSNFERNFNVRGKGNLALSFADSVVVKNVLFRAGGSTGAFTPTGGFTLSSSTIGRNLTVKGLDSVLSATIDEDSAVGKNVSLRARDGQLDLVVRDESFLGQNLDVKLRDGDLNVDIGGSSIVAKNLSVKLRDGDGDVTLFSGVEVGLKLTTKMRDGEHSVVLDDTLIGKNVLSVFRNAVPEGVVRHELSLAGGSRLGARLDVRSKAGPSLVVVSDAQVEKPVSIKFGNGLNELSVLEAMCMSGLSFVGGQQDDVVDIANSVFGSGTGSSAFKLGNGNNELGVQFTSFDSKLNIKAGSGDDEVNLTNMTVTGALSVKLGKGNNAYAPPDD